jgi:hypothetical protein
MENVSFTFDDAQRISDSVLANERSKYAVKPVDLTSQSDEFVVIYVTATTKFSDGTQDGNLSFWNEITHLYAAYDPVQTVRVRAANTADTLPVGYVFARFQGNTTRSGVAGPLYIAVTVRPIGGTASITVVTDVVCTPGGLEVTSATLSGADSFVANDFLSLTDVAAGTYLGNANRVVKVNSTATGLTFGAITDSTAATFIGLVDAPAVYGSTNTYKPACVAVSNAGLAFYSNLVTTQDSITGGGNPCDPSYVALNLVNDNPSPGYNKYYGTSSSGVKGWQSIQSLLDAIADLTDRVTALEAL